NDGVGNNSDAFPDDAAESVDTDGDGVGNNADTDDDNDGYEDQTEINSNADPLDALIYPYSGGRIGLATISGYSDRNQDFYEIAVKRHLSDQGVVSIDYRTSDRGSAIAGEHFEMVSGTLAWADGDKTPKIIKVPLLGEPGGTRANLDFGVVLENLQGNAMYDATRGRVVLKDTGIDANWSGNIIPADFRTVTAEGETHEISFERIGGSFGALTLTVGFLESSFVSPYVDSTFTTTVTWADGELGAKLVAMPISDLDSSDGNRRSSQIWVEVLDIQSEDGFAHYWDQPWAGFPGSFKNIFSVLVVDDDLCDREECSLYFNSGYFYAYDDDVDLTWWVYRRDFGSENTPIERTFSTSLGQEITLNWDANDVSPRAIAVTDRQQNTGASWNGFDAFTIFSDFTRFNANLAVTDSDNDGVVDLLDLDADNDGTVDYLDVDADGDGLSNEEEILNNRGNWLDADSDNDGTSDADDQMPFDANETLDFDSDGIGNNADEDDDNDGAPDVDDAFPLDAAESLDTDGDGIGNNADTDDDNDDVADSEDAFPFDATESADIDGDSIGDNADEDNDNDGAPDVDDAFPLNAAESLDTDGDGVGNNADADDDNDDVADSEDAFPLDATESADIDGDGIGDNADAFPTDSTESVDTDSDGVGNNADICLNIANPDQLDTDSDGYGDVCDLYPVDQELWSMKIEDALAQIEDENLRACIESPDNSISPAGSSGIQVSEITQIHCNSVIASLSGLENFTSVNTLILDRLVCDDLGRCERPFPSALNLFSDLSPLAELTSLQRLTLFNAQIDDVSALSNLIEIGSLDLSLEFRAETSARITDISALAGMTKLADLRLGYHTVSDLSALPNESVFSYLDLTGNNVSDFSSVTMGSISQLYITGNPVADYGPFESTQFLVLGMRIENDLDRAFAAASNAFVFGLGNNNFVPDFAFLSEKFTNMFVCFSCGLDDPQALMSLKQAVDQNDSIAVLNVSRNGIRDLAPLAGVQLAAQSPPLMFQKSINVSKNALTSLEPLKSIEGLTSIFANDNPLLCSYVDTFQSESGITVEATDCLSDSEDDDGDGVINLDDARPLDAAESADSDGDFYGDNEDAFPDDADESVDTDGDGIGNNADTDDDGDGVNDENDAFPLDAPETFKFAYTFDASQLGTPGHVLMGFVAGNLLPDGDTIVIQDFLSASLAANPYLFTEDAGIRAFDPLDTPKMSLSGAKIDFWVCPQGFTSTTNGAGDCSFGDEGGFLFSDDFEFNRENLVGPLGWARAGIPEIEQLSDGSNRYRDEDIPINIANWSAAKAVTSDFVAEDE
ncbi:hypothetical protein OAS78_10435, partial [Pseudomonadales bacterium]|nr:hypothetical protein [Pseudomonadales bacterium]